ncbi:MAG: hypothetical protein BEN18_07775 [Epulopiscium sp. Nuni2H_MBin001]|nr:MAG: hypothetical protein BEN18_07775 [Epulopiscium sp. Nuni2H_MBin001]
MQRFLFSLMLPLVILFMIIIKPLCLLFNTILRFIQWGISHFAFIHINLNMPTNKEFMELENIRYLEPPQFIKKLQRYPDVISIIVAIVTLFVISNLL